MLDGLHYLSTGAASFARGLNDPPEMAALLLVVPGFDPLSGCLAVGGLVAHGGSLDAGRVAETLGKKATAMDPGQGFAASLATAGLVTAASLHGLPVSTTHISVRSLLGIGVVTRPGELAEGGGNPAGVAQHRFLWRTIGGSRVSGCHRTTIR